MTARGWVKSSRSSGGSNACVEVRFGADTVGVRDSKNVPGPALEVRTGAWRAFLASLDR